MFEKGKIYFLGKWRPGPVLCLNLFEYKEEKETFYDLELYCFRKMGFIKYVHVDASWLEDLKDVGA